MAVKSIVTGVLHSSGFDFCLHRAPAHFCSNQSRLCTIKGGLFQHFGDSAGAPMVFKTLQPFKSLFNSSKTTYSHGVKIWKLWSNALLLVCHQERSWTLTCKCHLTDFELEGMWKEAMANVFTLAIFHPSFISTSLRYRFFYHCNNLWLFYREARPVRWGQPLIAA